MTAQLVIEGLSKSFGGVQAVRDVSFDLQLGERLAMIGPNGAGKSTCFNLIGGQLTPDSGSVRLKSHRLDTLRPDQRYLRGLGRTFQIGSVFSSMTLEENLLTALAAAEGLGPSLAQGAARKHQMRAQSLLASVGLADLRTHQSAELAYGDIKRLELAMALAGKPSVLLMDEPTAGMAPGERHDLMALVAGIASEQQISLLFTEHDMDIVFDHAERILVLDHGSIIAEGAPAQVRADARVRQVYLGEDF